MSLSQVTFTRVNFIVNCCPPVHLEEKNVLPYSTLLHLAEVLWNSNIPLLVCRTYGLVGYMRVVIKEHTG